ncbi:MAG: GNAT family N-acetyltransferase [Candidatus Marinimicrobia bacterium]|nr:GNAT family N-acetyltransferase [Candidatus Neomarinimicrobiota bacterium]
MEIIKISPNIEIRSVPLELNIIKSLEMIIFGSSRATASRVEKIRQQGALLLIAYDGMRPIGFKLGYGLADGHTFFSWLGGVDPNYRRQGVAQALLETQERHVKKMGIATLYFTSFDRFPAMILLGRKNGYVKVKTAVEGGEKKYWFEKQLL